MNGVMNMFKSYRSFICYMNKNFGELLVLNFIMPFSLVLTDDLNLIPIGDISFQGMFILFIVIHFLLYFIYAFDNNKFDKYLTK